MNDIKIIEVKSEIGAGTRGASLGVEAMKIASLDLKSDLFRQYDSVEVENVNELLFDGAEHAHSKFIDGVLIMEERVCLEVYETLLDDHFPLVMAGDHSTAYGTIAGIKKANPKKRLGAIWIDAHADIHSPYTTPSGNMHGMTVAMACDIDNLECKINDPKGETIEYWEQIKNVGIPGAKIYPEDIVYIAVRDLEKPENYLINKYGMGFITTEEVKKMGAQKAAQQALKMLDHCDLIYVSFDVDSIDSRFSTGTGTPVPNGLTVEEAKQLNEELALSPKLCAWEIVEVNPTLDTENRMAESAFEILEATAKRVASRPVPSE
ncbi:MAG: arginase [Cyclobacteriaceae bacterium]|nr:arginase [Cyclobacteriaceae bacterium]MCB9237046.1 arginase [Flammeovirgaceae bacterium]MCB0498383.1 arginase [Cyclobacteriaceae bacterium]MCO5271693.1 arginase [Cyclobacteriaceae bacterium]MCW5901243.1 arginase [Cyclobacteriaceae bacterium]